MSSFFVVGQNKDSKLLKWEAQADTLLSHEDYQGALEILNKIAAKTKLQTKEDLKILYKTAFSHYGLKNYDKALTDINLYIQNFPDEQARLLRAYIYQDMGNKQELLNELNNFIEQSPGNPDLLRWRASILVELGKNVEAQKDLRYLISIQPEPELQLYLGLTHYYLNNVDSAFLLFDEVIRDNPTLIQAYLYPASLLLEEGYYDQSLEYLNTALTQEPGNELLLYYKGVALVENKNVDVGCACLRKAFYSGLDDAADYLKEYCFGQEE